MRLETTSHYRSDHIYEATIKAAFFAFRKSYDCKGTWKVEGDLLTITITQTDHEKYMPKGSVHKMSKLQISRDRMSYVYQGKKEVERRVG